MVLQRNKISRRVRGYQLKVRFQRNDSNPFIHERAATKKQFLMHAFDFPTPPHLEQSWFVFALQQRSQRLIRVDVQLLKLNSRKTHLQNSNLKVSRKLDDMKQ
jgi:hypothetical protein